MPTEHDVRVLALPDSMHRILFRDRIEIVPGDLSDPEALEEAVDGIDWVFHTALVSPPPVIAPQRMMAINTRGTEALVSACAGRIRRFVLISSNNVYMPHRSPAMWPLTDDAPREAHGNPQQHALGESLIGAEDAVFAAAERGELEFAILRPTVVTGRKCPFVEQMIVSILQQPETIEAQRRMWDVMQWSHGKDVARAALLVAEHEAARNECFLVAGAEPVTIYDIQSEIWELMNIGRPDNPHADLARRNNLGLPKFEPRKLSALGWAPQTGIRECVGEVLARLEFYSSASIKLPEFMLE